MAVSYQVPGVYIQEVSSARSIQGVSTDIALFMGMPSNYTLSSYPANYPPPSSPAPTTPQLVTSWNQYISIFGTFVWDFYLAYAVYNFFAAGGTACYVLNSISPSKSSMTSALSAGTVGAGSTTSDPVKSSMAINVVSPWLSYKVPPPPPPKSSSKNKSALNKSYTASAEDVTTSDIYIMTNYDNPATDPKNAPANPLFSITVLVPVQTPSSEQSQSNQQLQYYAKANNCSLYTDPTSKANYYILEKFSGFTSVDLVVNPSTGLSNIQQRINGSSLFIMVSVEAAETPVIPLLSNALQPLGVIATITQTVLGDTSYLIDLIDELQTVSIVAEPDNVNCSTTTTQTSNINALLSALESTGKAIAVVDSPYYPPDSTDHTTDVLGFVQGNDGAALNSSYGAIYYPWVWVLNPNNGVQILMPASGLVTGRYAYTSTTVGIFGAPAGISEGQLSHAVAISEKVTYGDQQILNPAGINVIKPLLSYGICIWGARTFLQSGLFYVNVRRLLIYIEQSIYQSIQWVVFQPNNSTLWGTVTRDISAFLYNLWQQGALVGASAAEAYYVVCDASNNTPTTMAEGILYIDIGVAPVTPAEFVVVRIAQIVQPA